MLSFAYDDFNPTLVQLEFVYDGVDVKCLYRFQSHIGAIRIETQQMNGKVIKVFQSHIGAIRIELYKLKESLQESFQSHIGAIRIEKTYKIYEYLKRRFQSHIGAIRIACCYTQERHNREISIPHWCN